MGTKQHGKSLAAYFKRRLNKMCSRTSNKRPESRNMCLQHDHNTEKPTSKVLNSADHCKRRYPNDSSISPLKKKLHEPFCVQLPRPSSSCVTHTPLSVRNVSSKCHDLNLPITSERSNTEIVPVHIKKDVQEQRLQYLIDGASTAYETSIEKATEWLIILRSAEAGDSTNISKLTEEIIRTFNKQHKYIIFGKIKSRVVLSTSETTLVNCLTLSVSRLGQMNQRPYQNQLVDDIMKYLDELIESTPPNKVAERMSEIFLIALCNISEGGDTDFIEGGKSTLSRYFTTYRTKDVIRIPSAYLMVLIFNRKNTTLEDDMKHEVVNYLNGIVENNKSESINGFIMGSKQRDQIRMASSKINQIKKSSTSVSWN